MPTATVATQARSPPAAITHLGQQICWVWQELPVPVIAAVHGHAFGGGLQLALGADIRIAHPDTKLSVRELHWGITPDMTGTFMLTRLVRSDVARELTYTARVFDAGEGYALGLVTRLSDRPYDDAMALASEIAGRNPDGVRGAKRLFNRMFTADAAEQFADERRVIASLIGTPNQVEAISANVEGRAAGLHRRRSGRTDGRRLSQTQVCGSASPRVQLSQAYARCTVDGTSGVSVVIHATQVVDATESSAVGTSTTSRLYWSK